jgi:ariadne-1
MQNEINYLYHNENEIEYNPLSEDYDYEEKLDIDNDTNKNIITFLKPDEIIKEREKVIKDAMENLCLERDDAILALIYFKWNMDNLLTFWYDDVEGYKEKCGIILSKSSLKLLKEMNIETNTNYCLICFEEKNDENKNDFISLKCGHTFCNDCFYEYLKEKVKDILISLTSKCPQDKCSIIIPESLFFTYFSKKNNNKESNEIHLLYKSITKNFTDSNDDIKLCPNPNCNNIIKCLNHNITEIECSCGSTFCFNCYKESHRPCSCEMVLHWNKKNKSVENYDEMWIKANTKKCPHCGQNIERSHGCNYMLCDKKAGGCGKAFCFVCETDWEKHSQDHFNCNKYTEEVKKKEMNANIINQQLKRTSFYYDRYLNYLNACNEIGKLEKDLNDKISIIMALYNVPLKDLEFFQESVKTILRAKRTLKYTYIFGYYMKDNQKKDLFEFSQGLLQRNVEMLHQNFIAGFINDMISIQDNVEFKIQFDVFKNRVLNLKNATDKYRESCLNDIENNFIDEINQKLLD